MTNNDEQSLDQVRRRMKFRDLKPIGYCYNPRCNSELTNGRLFCDKSCSDEYDTIHGIEKEAGDAAHKT